MSASTNEEAVRMVKVGIIFVTLYVVSRYLVVPAIDSAFAGLGETLKLLGIALAAAIIVDMFETELR